MSYNNPNVQRPANTPVQSRNPDPPSDACLYVLAFFFPFIAVGILRGGCSSEMWLCLLMTYFFYIPGLIYAIYIISKDSDNRKARDVEMGGQGYATQLHHQQPQQPMQPHFNQQPLHQHQAYPTEGTYPQAGLPKHEPAPMVEPPVSQQPSAGVAATAPLTQSDIAPQVPPPTYAEGPTQPLNEKAQYMPPSN